MYSEEELLYNSKFRTFTEKHTQASMLMGGIGTGCFSIGSRGQLQDWELFNRPSKGLNFPFTFFAIHGEGHNTQFTKVLESRLQPPYAAPQGLLPGTLAGLPRFAHSEMNGRFPFAKIVFEDDTIPVEAGLEAFNPFIPLNSDDSGIPAVLMRYRIHNKSEYPLTISIVGSLYNASGYDGVEMWGNFTNRGNVVNEYRENDLFSGIFFDNDKLDQNDPLYGNLALTGRGGEVSYKTEWNMGQRIDGIHDFWNDFSKDGRLTDQKIATGEAGLLDKFVKIKIGSFALTKILEPDTEGVFEFCISWCYANRIKAWPSVQDIGNKNSNDEIVRNYYAVKHPDAYEAAKYFWDNLGRLERETAMFTDAVFNSTLPAYVIEAATSNLSILKSTTCFRLENKNFFGFEGSLKDIGSCPGNCTHVWYYAQAMAFLFPELEKNMRETDFLRETDEYGKMEFRALSELNGYSWDFVPAVDGQMGTIARLYREWIIGGDDEFLKKLWPKAVLALEYGIKLWDTDEDYVLDGCMHVDYDVEFYGPNPLGNTCYLVALLAAEKMALYLGDQDLAIRYQMIFDKASKRADEIMWNGEYYEQKIDDVDKYKYQHGKGVLADQLMGQYYANILDLGYVMDKKHIKTAAENIFKYNFRENFFDHANMQRVYAINDDKGLLMCTWPHGGRPRFPFYYSEEVWSRTEYPLASILAYENNIFESLTLVKAIQDRYDGIKRNPWNEFECGNHYSGIMGSWSMIIALSGYKVDLPHNKISFEPRINQDHFRCFFSCGTGWGVYTRNVIDGEIEEKIDVLYGSLPKTT